MKILMVLTSNEALGSTGKKTGFWLEEFASPYYMFKDAGATITVASPRGGRPPIDPKSETPGSGTEATERLKTDLEGQAVLATTVKLSDVSAAAFDAVFYPGGHGPLWDLVDDAASIALIEAMFAASKPCAFVCHGPGVLRRALTPEGLPIVKDKDVTGFSNSEELEAGLADVVPFLVEDMLKTRGARYAKEKNWAPHVAIDGPLITGQNPASSKPAAKAMLEKLRFFSVKGAVQAVPWAIA